MPDAGKAMELRSGENPARWRGHLDQLLPKRRRLSRGHYPALPYHEVPSFVARLRGLSSCGARVLEFTTLTAARTGEVLGARWAEFDFDSDIWIIPPERMKNGVQHRVPLSPVASCSMDQFTLRAPRLAFGRLADLLGSLFE